MAASTLALDIEQGATFEKKLTWTDANGNPIDLTGYDARMQVRKKKTNQTVLLDLNLGNGGLILGGVTGTIELFISASDTTAITWKQGIYDLELITPTSKVIRFIEGAVSVSLEVTR